MHNIIITFIYKKIKTLIYNLIFKKLNLFKINNILINKFILLNNISATWKNIINNMIYLIN
jgi:hypothetical protein